MEKGQRVWLGVSIVLFIIGALLLSAGLVVDLNVFPNAVKSNVKTGKVLGLNSDGSFNDFTQTFAYPEYLQAIQFWTFDYKNPIGILNRGMYPDMVEKGPYTYTEKILNDNIRFSADGEQMTFSQATQYNFNPNASCPTCDPYKDKVLIPDISFVVAMNSLMAQLDGLSQNPLVQKVCSALAGFLNKPICEEIVTLIEHELGVGMDLFDTSPFVTVTVDQLLFSGYDSPVVDKVVNRIIAIGNALLGVQHFTPVPPVKVALNPQNGTTDFLYTVLTGKKNYQQSGYITSFTNLTNNQPASDGSFVPRQWWPHAFKNTCLGDLAAHALQIWGTNGDFFKSYIKRTDTLPIYVENLCRSAGLVYDRDVTTKEIDGYRFVLPSTEFDYSLPQNCGFCNPLKYGAYNKPVGSTCLPSGLLDISGCNQGNPILMSKPHFYQADPIVKGFVPRFRPNYDNDETTLDIEPITGTVLAAMKKLQVNMLMNQWPRINAYKVLRPGAYPLVWLNESAIIDIDTRDELKSQLFTPQKIVEIASWTSVGVGGFLMAVSAIIIFVLFCVGGKETTKDD